MAAVTVKSRSSANSKRSTGEEPIFGIMFDGGFAMGADLPLFEEVGSSGRQVTTSTGRKAVVGNKANFGTLSSGGLY